MTEGILNPPSRAVDSPELAKAENLLRDEFGQAWQHYRHNETLRTQYLNYALSITLASVAVSVPLSTARADAAVRLLVAGAFVLMYTLFIAFALATVLKIRLVNRHYAQVWLDVRTYFYRSDSGLTFDTDRLNVWSGPESGNFHPLLRMQAWAEFVLQSLLVLASVVAVALVVALAIIGAPWWQVVIMTTNALVVAAIAVTFMRVARR